MYNILASGSEGNAIIYFGSILVDCGVPFSTIQPFVKDINLVLLTHVHGDHLKQSTIKRLVQERPSIRFGCGEFLLDKLPKEVSERNVDIYEAGLMYDYGEFKISPIILYHDVKNFGYRMYKDGKKIIHATDTNTLEGISAKDYDLYAIEANYCEDKVWQIIKEKRERGEFAHEKGSINSHLSKQQAQNFVINNASKPYEFIMLHQSKSAL